MLKDLLTGIQPLLKFSTLNNHKCKFIEIDSSVSKKIHNTRGSGQNLRADASKYRPEVYKSEKSKILKKIHKVALGKLLT